VRGVPFQQVVDSVGVDGGLGASGATCSGGREPSRRSSQQPHPACSAGLPLTHISTPRTPPHAAGGGGGSAADRPGVQPAAGGARAAREVGGGLPVVVLVCACVSCVCGCGAPADCGSGLASVGWCGLHCVALPTRETQHTGKACELRHQPG
jgi:hypothetical protein